MWKVTTTLRAVIATPRRRAVGGFCVYLAIALVATWPLVMSLGSAISYGCEAEATVPLFNLWTLWWNADRAAHGLAGYWTAPIFHSTHGTFAFSEAQPTMIVVAPLVWLTGNRVLAYNVYQLLILTLNGWSGQRLLRRVGHRPWLAFCGGALVELLPFVWWQLGVVQLTTLFGIIWTIHALLDVFETGGQTPLQSELRESPTEATGEPVGAQAGSMCYEGRPLVSHPGLVWLRLGGAFGLTYWMCNYWGLFLAILLVPASVWLWNGRMLRIAFWRDVLLAGLVASAMILPIAYIQRTLSKEQTWVRNADLIVALSAHARDLTDTPWTPLIPGLEHPEATRATVWPLGGGGLKLLLAPLGLLAAVTTRGRRRWGLFVATFGLLAFGLSLGPNNRFADTLPGGLAGQSPYEWLQQFVPGFSLIRSPFRFVMFVQLAAVWLSVEALDLFDPRRWKRGTRIVDRGLRIADCGTDKETTMSLATLAPLRLPSALGTPQSAFQSLLVQVPLIVASLIVTLEVLPARQRLYPCPSSRDLPVWVLWLRDSAPVSEPIACLPFPTGFNVGNYEATAVWMYWSMFHRHPLVNGYSGFFPQSFLVIKDGLEQYDRSVDEDEDEEEIVQPRLKLYPRHNPGLAKLNASGAVYAVVLRTFATRDDVWEHPATKYRWAWVAGDESAQIDIYRIEPPLAE